MATTKIWAVHGWLGHVVLYAENPDKTTAPLIAGSGKVTDSEAQGLVDVINYAMAEEKTVDDENPDSRVSYVTGINCTTTDARNQMMKTKRDNGKTGGVVAYHGYQSFKAGEVTPELAHKIAVELATRLWGDKYEVLVATHLDKKHTHSHFVLNSVSFVDGSKFKNTMTDYHDMRRASDELCREYGLSVIENSQPGKSKQYSEWRADQKGQKTWRSIIKKAVDEAIDKAMNEQEFYTNLRNLGYEYKIGKDISVRPPGKERYLRLERNFGEDYSEEAIRERTLSHIRLRATIPKQNQRRYQIPQDQVTGGLVVLFRIYHGMVKDSQRPDTNQDRAHFLLKEDHRTFVRLTSEVSILARNGIHTPEQLAAHRIELTERVARIEQARQDLRNKARRKSEQGNLGEIHPQIKHLTNELKKLRKEVGLCDDIDKNSRRIAEKVMYLQAQQREEADHGQFRRRSGADRQDFADGHRIRTQDSR
jgi:hypothetical protein